MKIQVTRAWIQLTMILLDAPQIIHVILLFIHEWQESRGLKEYCGGLYRTVLRLPVFVSGSSTERCSWLFNTIDDHSMIWMIFAKRAKYHNESAETSFYWVD